MKYNDVRIRVDSLAEILNGIAGIEVTQHHFDGSNQIDGSYVAFFLHVDESNAGGLFCLTRAIDKRYSHGVWSLKLSAGDQRYENGDRPITYLLKNYGLFTFEIGEIGGHVEELIDNLIFLKGNAGFLEHYDLTPEVLGDIKTLEQYRKEWKRQSAIEGLGI